MKKPFLLFTVILTVFLFASSVYAADIRLSSSCSLADAIIAANRNRAEGDCPAGRGADTIILSQDITLRAELPAITSKITIEGNGYTISGNHRYRIFYNDGGALTINDLTITKGYVEAELIRNEDGTLQVTTTNSIGGAIYNANGTVSLVNSSFSDNSTEHDGGAIYNDGELSISDSAFKGNSTEYDGGAIYNDNGTVSISDSSFSNNSANSQPGGQGGAIYNDNGTVSISNSAFSNNSADSLGGAIDNKGELSISDSAFKGNSAGWGGGVIDNKGELSISDSNFSDNSADIEGGAIRNVGHRAELSISDSSFSNNSAWDGGAIDNSEELSITNSIFSNNSAESDGGAISNGWGELSIVNSAFSHNSAERSGGAIYNGEYGKPSIGSSTFSGNSADKGGAIYSAGELSVSSSTFSGNSADKGGAIYNREGLSIINSIIAGGENACYSESRIRHNINNFIQDGSCSPAFSGDPKLGKLIVPEDGSPAYFPLLAGSRAIDAAYDDLCPETDQIGTERPQGAGCDIGAIEYAAP